MTTYEFWLVPEPYIRAPRTAAAREAEWAGKE